MQLLCRSLSLSSPIQALFSLWWLIEKLDVLHLHQVSLWLFVIHRWDFPQWWNTHWRACWWINRENCLSKRKLNTETSWKADRTSKFQVNWIKFRARRVANIVKYYSCGISIIHKPPRIFQLIQSRAATVRKIEKLLAFISWRIFQLIYYKKHVWNF
jgi:hypothetical protein